MASLGHHALAAGFLAVWLATPLEAVAQENPRSDAASESPAAYVPESAIASFRTRPQAIFQLPRVQWMPIEVIRAWGEVNLGIDPTKIEEIRVVSGMPAGPGVPPFGAVIHLGQPFDPEEINKELLRAPEPTTINGRRVYRIGDRTQEFYLHALGPRTALLATPTMFESMIAQPQGAGPLAERIRANPIGDQHVQLIVAVEPVRPLLSGLVGQASRGLPPQIREVRRIPELLQAVIVEGQSKESAVNVRAELVGNDASAAGEMKQILDQAIDFGRQMFLRQAQSSIREQGPVADAQRAYLQRIARQMAQSVTPRQENERLVIEAEPGVSVASTGFMVGLLLPAVQAAREAARRMSASNNLKQIGLAMHNYHSAYRHLPPRAITDDSGKPLLSWRVALLPFLEQQPLYEQFRLDEPWDSDHNRALLEKMPELYRDPSVSTDPGHTVFQVPLGEDYLFGKSEPTRFRDVTDGLSNTIMVVEADQKSAVPWTAPRDVQIDPDDPLATMGHTHPGGFHVLFADGAVKFITHSIDTELFKAMLTRAGDETIGDF